ncbi:hypothetical protein JAO29_03015 [Edaphobacter sp. HDX4]|uniref:hypothetical protein n=1 Tax=Edaphobacter sp. HDX4 TaxID=2794064 RepID=UPI002FE61BF9
MKLFRASATLILIAVGMVARCVASSNNPPCPENDAQQTGAAVQIDPASVGDDTAWHVTLSPYLWFPGVSGTVGVFGRNASVHLGPVDVLSNFDIGLMGAAEFRKKRFVLPVDFLWVKLQADRATPFNPGVSYINAKLTQTIVTPGFGYRVIKNDKLNVDARIALRFWHLGQNLTFQPSGLFSNTSQSANWIDVVGGGKIEAAVAPKLLVTIVGDAGGGGANLDYQFVALGGFKVSKAITLQAGWRYLDIDYTTGRPFSFVHNVHQQGAIAGLTIRLK